MVIIPSNLDRKKKIDTNKASFFKKNTAQETVVDVVTWKSGYT